jgi:hypothetical protein
MPQYKKFNLNEFFNYYNDPANLSIDPVSLRTTFYVRDNTNRSIVKPITKRLSQNYILVNGNKLYVTYYISKGVKNMLFTTPVDINGVLYDFHYHFGLTKRYKSYRTTRTNKRMDVVFFHKTIQDPTTQRFKRDECYFEKNIPLNDISQIKCINEKTNTMSDVFPIYDPDFSIIEEIINRPNYSQTITIAGGSARKTRRARRKYKQRKTIRNMRCNKRNFTLRK